ncbi:MAG: MotA/TolQ/ExbB proton channel family protein [Bdellovibrionia bacterium]
MQNWAVGFELIKKGGFMMIPLLLSGLVALTVILERFFLLNKNLKTPQVTVQNALNLLAQGHISEALQLAESHLGPACSVLKCGLESFSYPLPEFELKIKNRAEAWIPLLEKRIEWIDTVITAAPLMGLLGTITGMMASFESLSAQGVKDPHAITGGVAEALIATATGLIIALVCLVCYNHLTSRIKGFIQELESLGSELTEHRLASDRTRRPQSISAQPTPGLSPSPLTSILQREPAGASSSCV